MAFGRQSPALNYGYGVPSVQITPALCPTPPVDHSDDIAERIRGLRFGDQVRLRGQLAVSSIRPAWTSYAPSVSRTTTGRRLRYPVRAASPDAAGAGLAAWLRWIARFCSRSPGGLYRAPFDAAPADRAEHFALHFTQRHSGRGRCRTYAFAHGPASILPCSFPAPVRRPTPE